MPNARQRRRNKRRSNPEIGLRHKHQAVSKRNPDWSYEEYLASDLWKVIRLRVLARDRHKCQGCGSKAQAVHHKSYDAEVMEGGRDSALVAICFDCHELIEFNVAPSGAKIKNSLKEANRKLDEIQARRLAKPRRTPVAKPEPKIVAVQAAQVFCEKCTEEGLRNFAPKGKTLCRGHQGLRKKKIPSKVGKGVVFKFVASKCLSSRCKNPAYGSSAYCRICQGVFGNTLKPPLLKHTESILAMPVPG